jgi:competence protein ComGC
MKKHTYNRIVVAIIGILVAISVPILVGQLERSRETTDAANIRTHYGQVMAHLIPMRRFVFTFFVNIY